MIYRLMAFLLASMLGLVLVAVLAVLIFFFLRAMS